MSETVESLPTVRLYTWGLIYASVCVVKGTPREVIEAETNAQQQTGIESRWQVSGDKFATGETNPCQCPDHPDREHYLLNC